MRTSRIVGRAPRGADVSARKRTPVSVSRLVSRQEPAEPPGLAIEGGENALALFLQDGEADDLLEQLAQARGYVVIKKQGSAK